MVPVVVGMMSANAVTDPGAAVVIMFGTSRLVGVDVVVLVGAEEGLAAETTEEVVVTSGGCRTLDGVDVVGGAVVLLRRRHPDGGMPRLIGGDLPFVLESFCHAVLYLCLYVFVC